MCPQFRYKRRVYTQSYVDDKQLAKLHTKVTFNVHLHSFTRSTQKSWVVITQMLCVHAIECTNKRVQVVHMQTSFRLKSRSKARALDSTQKAKAHLELNRPFRYCTCKTSTCRVIHLSKFFAWVMSNNTPQACRFLNNHLTVQVHWGRELHHNIWEYAFILKEKN